jgi:NAD(P)-dependent dehydrogenase (short-subunit alcohol dehydrogenase family)
VPEPHQAEAARATIAERHPSADVELLRLDLAVQGQILDAAAEATERFDVIDILINNAGVLGTPRSLTVDGFETVLGVKAAAASPGLPCPPGRLAGRSTSRPRRACGGSPRS